MTLYEINEQILSCVDMETGEVLDSERLDQLQMDMATKVENIGLWIKNLESDAAALKNEAKALTDRQKAAENKADSLKRYLSDFLGGQKFETPRLKISYRASEVLDIAPDAIVPAEYLRFKEPEINKAELKRAVKFGTEIKGVKLVTKSNIQIK